MQRRMLSLLAVCCTGVVGIAAAQTPSARFGLGGGVTIPVGTYKDADKLGWHGLGMVQLGDPKSGGEGKRGDLGGRRIIKKNKKRKVGGSVREAKESRSYCRSYLSG